MPGNMKVMVIQTVIGALKSVNNTNKKNKKEKD